VSVDYGGACRVVPKALVPAPGRTLVINPAWRAWLALDIARPKKVARPSDQGEASKLGGKFD